jgi:hypothetical protein
LKHLDVNRRIKLRWTLRQYYMRVWIFIKCHTQKVSFSREDVMKIRVSWKPVIIFDQYMDNELSEYDYGLLSPCWLL